MKYLELFFKQVPMEFLSGIHIAILFVMIALISTLTLISSTRSKKENIALITNLMVAAFIFFVFKQAVILLSQTYTLSASLPLGINDLIFIIMLMGSFKYSELISNFLSYFGVAFLLIYSIFNPQLYPYFNVVVILDMLMIVMCISSFSIFVKFDKFRPRGIFYKKSLMMLILIGVIQFSADYFLGSHYLFLDWFSKATPFSLLETYFIKEAVYGIVAASILVVSGIVALWFNYLYKKEARFMVSDFYLDRVKRKVE